MKRNTRQTGIHPGEHLSEFLDEYGITPHRLAKDVHVSATRISEILCGKRAISADTALRLGRYFGTSAEFWMNLQANYDMESAKRDKSAQIARTITPLAAAG